MDKICLIIDDSDQQHNFEVRIRDVMSKKGYNVKAILIDPTVPDVLDDNDHINIEKLSTYIKDKINGIHIDVVATDYDLSDSIVNGLKIIEIIRNYCNRRKTPIVLYSGNLAKVLREIIDSSSNGSLLEERIKTLMLYHIHDFIDRMGYAESVNKILQNKEMSTKQIFLKKMREYSSMTFKSCYPSFEGKTLGYIADEIEKSTYHGEEFESELIEQVIAYLIDINSEKL